MLLEARDISFSYDDHPVLNKVSVGLPRGGLVSLLGPNGCGKTTLLKVLLGIYPFRGGEVRLDNRPLHNLSRKALAREMAYVPQLHRAAFAYQVLDVVLMGRLPHKSFLAPFSRRDRELALAALERLGIAHLRERTYTCISGGERQLVLIARALCQGAHTFILDEPVTGLDYGNQIRLLEQLSRLASEGYTFVKSTHFPDHALWISSHVVLLKDGRVIAEGKPEQVINKDTLFHLYGTEVDVWPLLENFRICVPERIRQRFCSCHDSRRPVHFCETGGKQC
ncbi:ABC transporter ATP-binding protein [Desulfuromonas sp. CSMB_57]|jgi:iron complex transport system ATP-binding protein|uniref:ABC transporter ATP-binding protein n=1 Tax=Desulfuromonas sp. CSMB_57 TaxID=2807629 RepID=UPI001CD38CF6|nr:ABC transporter ATP-binding protein [Desulfuromonas sp. CSMB_57]